MEEAEPTLEDALDGLVAASNYADQQGWDETAAEIGRLYQRVCQLSPDHEWEELSEEEIDEFVDGW